MSTSDYTDPLASAEPFAGGDPPLADPVANADGVEAIYGPGIRTFEDIERRAQATGVSLEDYAFGVREQAQEVAALQAPSEPAAAPWLDFDSQMLSNPDSEADWKRDQRRAEAAADAGITSLAQLERREWEAYASLGRDVVHELARDQREQDLQAAQVHLVQTIAHAQEDHKRTLAASREREHGKQEVRTMLDREVRRRGQSTVAAMQAFGQLPQWPR